MRRRAINLGEIWSDVLYFFESLLICLQSALDAAARLVHELFCLKGSRRRANWGWERWWADLERSDAPDGEFNRRCLVDLDVLVGELRNSIHGEVLTSELRQHVRSGEAPLQMGYAQSVVALEPELAAMVVEAAERQGGLACWSVRRSLPEGAALIDPWRYSEAAIALTSEALRSVIAALARHAFADTIPDSRAQDLWLGKEVQRFNAGILFGLGYLPAPR